MLLKRENAEIRDAGMATFQKWNSCGKKVVGTGVIDTKIIRASEKSYLMNKFESVKTDIKKTWAVNKECN